MVKSEVPVVEVVSTEAPIIAGPVAPVATPISKMQNDLTNTKITTSSPGDTIVASTVAPVVIEKPQVTEALAAVKPVNTKNTVKKQHAKTTVMTALKGSKDDDWDKGAGDLCPSGSPYAAMINLDPPFPYRGDRKIPTYDEKCQLLNPDNEKNGLVMVVGDSHADMSKPRFVKLHEDAVKAKKPFPTVVFKTRFGRALLPCRPEYYETIELLKRIKPQVAMFVVHYMQYLNPGAPEDQPYVAPPQCCFIEYTTCKEQSMDDVREMLNQYQADLSELAALGIKVYVVDQGPETYWQCPESWVNGNQLVMPLKVSRASWAEEYKWLYDPLHAAIAGANATLLDYTDNYSDGDEVFMTNPDGWPVMSNHNHLAAHTARYYLSVIDQVIDAALPLH
ncbi:hypothetical protein THRCLA_01457 [Thraustotheca clavata]|uniref:SGNH domain-containing protein n=1 Tax=Thraustotheca clavata TaxID=74557 RepID=A0A1W0A885_9STRA|nr:hypothetical protein THRCLA_01457 [Thraustotheca clavata]